VATAGQVKAADVMKVGVRETVVLLAAQAVALRAVLRVTTTTVVAVIMSVQAKVAVLVVLMSTPVTRLGTAYLTARLILKTDM